MDRRRLLAGLLVGAGFAAGWQTPAAADPVAGPAGPTRATTVAAPRPVPSHSARVERAYRGALRAAAAGRLDRARTQLEWALSHDARHRGTREALALLLIRSGEAPRALSLLAAGRDADPHHGSYVLLEARIREQMGDSDGAIRLLERAAAPLEESPEQHALLATLYQSVGRHEDAARLYGAVLRRD